MDRRRTRGIALVVLAGTLYGMAGVFTRFLGSLDAWSIMGWRSAFGGLFIMLWLAVEQGRNLPALFRMNARQWVMVPLAAVAYMCFIGALKLTTVANVMVVYATLPFITAGLAWLWGRERPTLRLVVASAVALGGVTVMLGGVGGPNAFFGVALMVLMNVLFGLMLVMARRDPGPTVLINGLGNLLTAAFGLTVTGTLLPTPAEFGILCLFGTLCAGLAMTLFIIGGRMVPSAEVALVGLIDVPIAPALVWLVFGEQPGVAAVVGGLLVVGAVIWHILPDVRAATRRGAVLTLAP